MFVWCNTLTELAVENLKLELREAAVVVAKFRCVVKNCQDSENAKLAVTCIHNIYRLPIFCRGLRRTAQANPSPIDSHVSDFFLIGGLNSSGILVMIHSKSLFNNDNNLYSSKTGTVITAINPSHAQCVGQYTQYRPSTNYFIIHLISSWR